MKLIKLLTPIIFLLHTLPIITKFLRTQGQLFGGPYDNNYYLGTLFQLDKDAATQDVSIGRGDELLGDTLRSTLAEITAQVCETDCARDMDFAAVNVKGDAPSVETVQERLNSM